MGAYEYIYEIDTDNDGLLDSEENEIGTDPNNPDTDQDGLLDGDEVNNYTTNPLNSDTDGDGLTDGEEVNTYKTDPLNSDTDQDGITDKNDSYPLDPRPILEITTTPIPLYAMPGRLYTVSYQGYDYGANQVLSPCSKLNFVDRSILPEHDWVEILKGECQWTIKWMPTDQDVGKSYTIDTILKDSMGQYSDPISFTVSVLEPLVVAPDRAIIVRLNGKDLVMAFEVFGGVPHQSEPYYRYELLDGGGEVIEEGNIYEDQGGKFRYYFNTSGKSGTYRLKVMDGAGFYTISGPIVVEDVVAEELNMDITDPVDPSSGGIRTLEDPVSVYNGATIEISAGSIDEPVTVTFMLVSEGGPYIPEDVISGDVVEIGAETSSGDAKFITPVEVSIPYGGISGIEDPRVYTFDEEEGRWIWIRNAVVDEVNKVISFKVEHFSLFTVLEPEELERSIDGGIYQEDYRIISFPGNPDDPDLEANLTQTLGPYDDTQWRCFAYDYKTDTYMEMNESGFKERFPLEPGTAYWLISRKDKDLKVKGLSIDPTKPFEGVLHPGWNMVGNPYDVPISMEDYDILISSDGVHFESILTTSLTDNYLYRFDPQRDSDGNIISWYSEVDPSVESIQPYEGYWLRSYYGSDLIVRIVPKTGQSAYLKPSISKKFIYLAKRSFIRLMDSVGGICMAESGSSEPPPPPGAPGRSTESIGVASGGGGCFIATAAYGSPIHPYVKILRQFRDQYLLNTVWGREFVSFYYKHSPMIADLISRSPLLRVITQIVLIPFVIFCYAVFISLQAKLIILFFFVLSYLSLHYKGLIKEV